MAHYNKGFYTPINSEKYVGTGLPCWRSSWELVCFRMFDNNPNIVAWASEPIKIPYLNPFTNKYTVYIPDFLVSYFDVHGKKHTEIIEVKPAKETFVEEAKTKRSQAALVLNMCKWKAAQLFANQHGMVFRVATEFEIFNNPSR